MMKKVSKKSHAGKMIRRLWVPKRKDCRLQASRPGIRKPLHRDVGLADRRNALATTPLRAYRHGGGYLACTEAT